MKTLIVCAILLFASLMLTKTTTDLVISPIENMITKVQAIATNPLKAAQNEENEQLALEELGGE
jgi:hypothetical protein